MGFKPCARIAGSPLKHLLTAKYLPNTKSNIYKNLWNNSTSVWNYSTTPGKASACPESCHGRSRNRRIRTHWRQPPRLRGAKVTKQVRAGEKLHQEGYSKSGRNIIRNGHISGREAITSGEASPTGRHKKKTRTGLFAISRQRCPPHHTPRLTRCSTHLRNKLEPSGNSTLRGLISDRKRGGLPPSP